MADAKPPRGGAAWEFLLLTFPGGLVVAIVLSILGGGILNSIGLAVWPIVSVIIVARRRSVAWSDWGLRVFDRRVLYGAAIAMIVVLAAVLSRWALTGQFLARGDNLSFIRLLFALPTYFVMYAVSEIPWRGFLLTELSRRGLMSAIVLSSLAAFIWKAPRAIAMLDEAGILVAALSLLALAGFQLIACWLRIRTGSIYAAAAFAAAWMTVAGPGVGAPSVLSTGVSAVLIVLTAALLLSFRLPRSDAWPSSITPSREPINP